jgi:pimeloyl-ACP methyl ester carboxylesterase
MKQVLTGVSLSLLVLAMTACSTEEPISSSGELATEPASSGLTITALSTQPWLVTGGDVLIDISLAPAIASAPLNVTVNGDDVTEQFINVSAASKQALLRNLPVGDSAIEARSGPNGAVEQLTITNYPLSGPIISGAHQTPFACQTNEFKTVTGEALGPALNANCAVTTQIDTVYLSNNGDEFKPFEIGGTELPGDMAFLTRNGEAVPFIVQVETGTVNRAIYEIAMLVDPSAMSLSPWRRSRLWNDKLVYTHGGGCRSGWHQQGVATGGVLNKGLLEQGYAITSSTLNVFGQNCNDLLASETHIMLKELFIERYGVPTYTIATGVSGGSYQSQQTADNYPGVFDGIIVGLSFPDVTSATIFTLADARLLHYYFAETNPGAFTPNQQSAVAGFRVYESIANLSRGAARLDPLFEETTAAEEQGGEISIEAFKPQLYSADNPAGIRATVYDHTVNVYGRVDGSNMAQRPLDNTGVQYGLAAFNAGVITPAQFIDLNRDIGGFDRDLRHVAERHRADRHAAKAAVESGRILFAGAGLATTPIIDYRSYMDDREQGDIHMLVHQFSTRARLLKANGHAQNQVMQIGGRWGFTESAPDLGQLFRQMDSWISAIQGDGSNGDLAEKVVRNKPSDLVDGCWDNRGAQRVLLEQNLSFGGANECGQLYPAYPTPRQVAGAPLANDVVSCQLKQISSSDYAVEFSAEQWLELTAVFPYGVCDWQSAIGNDSYHQGTWLSFGPSPVNLIQ